MSNTRSSLDSSTRKQLTETSELPGATGWDVESQDPYPTRTACPPQQKWIERQEAVVKGRDYPGPLSQDKLDEFEEKGFIFLPHFVEGEELKALQNEIRELTSREEYLGRDFSITEPQGEEIRSLFAVHFLSERLNALANDERLTQRVRQILGGDAYIHQSRINYKPGFVGKGFNWHSDFETWHAEDGMPRMHAVSASLILTDNHHFNGPLMLVPGSQNAFVPCVGETPEDNYRNSLKSQEIGVPSQEVLAELIAKGGGIEAATGDAGGLLLFDCNVLHASNANMSPDPRSNVFFVYNRLDNRCQAPFAAPKPRPRFLAHEPGEDWTP
ncbi:MULTISPECIES: ectoine hydroxylase [Halomonas]|uniref:Ectoine hydroxylase n=1 Tax=Halomonas ventosae TaxID=229007 RepID=A0A4R6I241_9GAMM|nr:ectoine hydroxylase [Halomonas ventosae]TDO15201.1 ectoine hydroxylase [Halomonas ventosae]